MSYNSLVVRLPADSMKSSSDSGRGLSGVRCFSGLRRLRVLLNSEFKVSLVVDGATASKQPLSVVVSDRNVSQRQLDEIGIRNNSGALLCLRHQGLRHSTPDHLVPFPAQQALLFGDDHHLTELTRSANARAFSYSRSCRLSNTFHSVLLALLFCSTH